MRLVIDTNRLIAGLLKDSTARVIILNDYFDFFAPEYMIEEIEKYRGYLCEKAKITEKEFYIILYTLLEKIEIVNHEKLKEYMDEAMKLMKDIDIKDSPFIATGLAVKADGIWTEDKHFYRQNKLKVYSTKDLLKVLHKL